MTTISRELAPTSTEPEQPFLPGVELSAREEKQYLIALEYSRLLGLLDRMNAAMVGAEVDDSNDFRLPAPVIELSDKYIPRNSNAVVGFRYGGVIGEMFGDCVFRFWAGTLPKDVSDPEVSEELLGCLVEIMQGSDRRFFEADMPETDGADNREFFGRGALRAWRDLA